MNILDIIENKKNGYELSKEEIEYFVEKYTKDEITDYQAAALIMAICINGMTQNEILDLTVSMANSGDMLDLSDISDHIVDKHSTGGVGDKVTLIVMPIVAALGIPVAKMSGRGLGITGGTIDKLESIPGYNVNIDIKEFKQNVKDIGISLMGQTLNLAPADKKIYALRDTISCTNSIPLIASSIMSKKIAAGANAIVLDVTCGSGAFMPDKEEARKLAKLMSLIGKNAGRETVCVLTNMDEPLGYVVGNSLEVIEAVNALKGNMADDVKEVILNLAMQMMKLSGKYPNMNENKAKIMEVIENGKALEKFKTLVRMQDGDATYIEDTEKFEKAKYKMEIKSNKTGYIQMIDSERLGNIAIYLGAGRKLYDDEIDNDAGITLVKKMDDKVKIGETIAYIYTNDESKLKGASNNFLEAYTIGRKMFNKGSAVLGIMTK